MDDDLKAQLDNIGDRVKERNAELPIQLPIWAESKRGMPNTVARSALFNARNHAEPRRHFDGLPLFSVGDTELLYEGEELRSDDEDVWLQVLHLSRTTPLERPILFYARPFLQGLGWNTGKRDYDHLHACIRRLQIANLVINTKGRTIFAAHLIDDFVAGGRTSEDGVYSVSISRRTAPLFEMGSYTLLDWATSLTLPTLAKKLHRIYSTHRAPYGAYKVETIMSLVDSKVKELRKFRYELRKTLDLLVERGFLETWEISKSDVVTVTRTERPTDPEQPPVR